MKIIQDKISLTELKQMAQNNRTRGVEDPAIREKIISLVNKLVQK